MKTINSRMLLEQLQSDVRGIILNAQQLQSLSMNALSNPPAAGKWSVAQVLEHLNFYARHYITSIEQNLHLHETRPSVLFTSGWLGNYFTGLMKPKEDNAIPRKMKAPKNAVPSAQPDASKMLEEFILHQYHLLNLLQIAKTANLNCIRIPTSLSKFISLKLGDTFRFFIAHEQRHFVQIESVLKVFNQTFKAAA